MSTKSKRILYGIGAVVVAVALAIGGTYAYTLFEHKSNPMYNSPEYLGRLVEDFDPDPEWKVDQEIKKEVSVKNMGGTEQFNDPTINWGDIYVRVNLKEHMDITPINYIYYPEADDEFNTRFMVDKDGNFVRFDVATGAGNVPSSAEMTTIKGSTVWSNVITDAAKRTAFLDALQASDFIKIKGYFDNQEYWYLVTGAGDPNGQYGAFVVMDRIADDSRRYSVTGSTRATGVDYSKGLVTFDPHEKENDECKYPIHYWDYTDPAECTLESHEYVEWQLGSSWILASDWNGKPVDKWILDPSTGWATWGNVLKPGQETDLLLESVTPIKMADGNMLYVIHVDMQATDLTDMQDDSIWGDDPWIIKDIFDEDKPEVRVTGVEISETTKAMLTGDTFKLNATVLPANATNKAVTWTSSNPAIAEVSPTGLVTAKTAGSTTITVTTADGGFTAQCAVTVTAATTPVGGVTLNESAKTMVEGDTFTLVASITPPAATNQAVSWSSADATVASVNSNGVVTANKVGTTTITVTTADGGYTARCTITVVARTIDATKVEINGGNKTITVGETYTPGCTVTPSNSTDTPVWSSSATGIARVDSATGVITGVSQGTATITVRAGTATDSITVTVVPATLPMLPVGPGPFEARHNETDPTKEFSLAVAIPSYDFANGDVIDKGSIKLEDVLLSSFASDDYEFITVAPAAGSGLKASDFSIAKDKSGDYGILFTYYGTQDKWAEAEAVVDAGGDYVYPTFTVDLVLSCPGYTDTPIKAKLTYDGSMYY